MATSVLSTSFDDTDVLFASKDAANTWRNSLTVPYASTGYEGTVKKCTHVADMTAIDGTSVDAGSAAADQLTMGTLDFTADADVKAAFIILAEKINYLTYRLEQAGVMASS
jgi:hypothetical protein